MRVYFDTCVVIYQVERVSPWATSIDALCQTHQPDIIVSDLVRMEALVLPLRRNDGSLRAVFNRYFEQAAIVDLPAAVFEFAAELRAACSLKTPDALHAACAIHHGCDELWTNDSRLASLAGRLRTRVVL